MVLDGAGGFVDVERPGRDLEERFPRRVPPLADEQHLAIPVQRDDRHGARVADDVAPGDRAIGTFDRVDPERQVVPAADDLGREQALLQVEIGAVARAVLARFRRIGLGSAALWLFRSAVASAALIADRQAAMACRCPSSESPVSESKR